MEILALLMLGLIAMLAIVPPIIRGKLDDSPISTTESFQRSMQEMGHSLEVHTRHPGGAPGAPCTTQENTLEAPGRNPRLSSPSRYPYRRNRAAVRRNRIMAFLLILAALLGVITLITGSVFCLVPFSSVCFLSVFYWALTIIVPRTGLASRTGETVKKSPQLPGRQAM